MSAYEALALVYDRLTEDVAYHRWADYIERQFKRSGREIRTVLDLACGTGSLSCVLAQRGYEVIGADASAEMLSVAMEKSQAVEGVRPIFLHQAMEHLDLYGTVDACICCLDSLNYIPARALAEGMKKVCLFLEPGGLFLFDIRPPWVLKEMDGQTFFDEREDLYCIWQAAFEEKGARCRFALDLFQREESGLWRRSFEEHVEYAHSLELLHRMMTDAGFLEIRQYGDRKLRAPKAGETRIFFTARKRKDTI
ncbi:MAG: class I SAM-dependent DNA methyltransferase [Oscillospiraceae bacterium]|jgi:SAM-dependent methyltransferase